jgi:alpha-tubulin suppressor-like RCC1 family protein
MDGSVWCWGKNGQGEVGKNPSSSATCTIGGNSFICVKVPNQVTLPEPAVAMGAGDQHTCVLSATKTYCFGANDAGEFGNGNAGDSYTPVEITSRAGSTIIAGSEGSTCSLIGTTIWCSGLNNHGEVGDNTTTTQYTPIAAEAGATRVAMGFQDTCSISNQFVFCWGDNSEGQVDTTGQSRHAPTAVPTAPLSVDVTVGASHVCARQATGTVTCWGRNVEGQVGTGSAGVTPLGPTVVSIQNVSQVAAGAYFTCARQSDGSVKCWGDIYGASPASITLPLPAIDIAAGSYHACAVLTDGSVYCWGWNAYGQYGNGVAVNASSTTPVKSSVCP